MSGEHDVASVEDASNAINTSNEINVWLLMWIILVFVFLLAPFCATTRRRKLCMSRFRERRWSVEVEEDESGWFSGAMERYNAANAAAAAAARESQNTTSLRKEDVEKVRLFILQRLNEFSTELKKEDFWPLNKDAIDESEGLNFKDEGDANKSDKQLSLEPVATDSTMDSMVNEETISPSSCPRDEDNNIEKIDIHVDETPEDESTDNENMVCIDICDGISIKGDDVDEHSDLKCGSVLSGTGQYTHVKIPQPGTAVASEESMDSDKTDSANISTTSDDKKRVVSKFCAVCLSEFEQGDRVSWSSNQQCPHVFHTECVVTWYIAMSKKTFRRRQREGIAEKDVTDFPMLCPCCRQDFLPASSGVSDQEDLLTTGDSSVAIGNTEDESR